MWRRKLISLAIATVFVWPAGGGAAWAETSQAPKLDPERLELAKRYVEASHVRDTFAAMLKSLMPAMLDQIARSNPKAPPELNAALSESMQELAPEMMDKLLDRAIPIYAETYTKDELQAIVTFVSSPAGQSMIAKSPQVTARLAPAMGELMPQLQADLIMRVCVKIDCTGARKAIKPSAS